MVRTFDMFCGGGGSGRGAEMAGAKIVGAFDRCKLAAKTYRLNFPKARVYQMMASSLSPARVSRELGKIDLLLASPECTSHSVAKGNKRRCEKSRATAFEVVRFAATLKPRWIVVENVMQMQNWRRFAEWLKTLNTLGYHTTVGVLDAKNHGTPQSRRRLFVVGDLEAEPVLPKSRPGRKKTVTSFLGTGESGIQPWAFAPVDSERRAEATIERAERAIATLGPMAKFIMVYYGSDGAGGFQTLDRPLRTITTLDRFAYVRPNGKGHEMRMLQPSELAAAMGFPECHQWEESTRRDRIRLIGNAVCPQVMHDVVKNLTSVVHRRH
jgi:DNA (cytosine-5)-methyltransferase 1